MAKTFLCFSSAYREELVEPLYNILTNCGLKIWYDYKCMLFGDSYFEKNFIEGIAKSQYAIVIITEDIFTKVCAVNELDYIMDLNNQGKIKVFPIIYNTTIETIPHPYKEWIQKSIYNTYNFSTINNIKNSALQIAAKLFTEITNDNSIRPLSLLVDDNNDSYEAQIMLFHQSLDSEGDIMRATSLYLLFLYHMTNKATKSDYNQVKHSFIYLLRQLVNGDPLITNAIVICVESLVRINY